MKRGIQAYILISMNRITVYCLNHDFKYEPGASPLKLIFDKKPVDILIIDDVLQVITLQSYEMHSIAYGCIGNHQNNQIWKYFKLKFSTSNKLGSRAIFIKFAKTYAKIAEQYANGTIKINQDQTQASYYFSKALD